VTKSDIEKVLKEASLFGDMVEQLEYSISNELVSSDVIGNSHASIVDGPATILSKDGRSAVIYVWYDNEYGYTRQVVRLAKSLAGVIRLTYY
jgi:glyceraldehyde 3-phosphate dehydrogenase